jgi:hypothetical protein
MAPLVGCFGGGANTPAFNPGRAAQLATEQFDANHDGALDAQELEKSPGLKAAARLIDRDGNGALSEQEIKSRIEYYRRDDLALMPFACQVTVDGQPLSGAQVRLVPEPFLSEVVKPASGTTDANGYASLSLEGQKYSGVQLGIYRVEISKQDSAGADEVPAKYNAQTTLGQEIASDVPDLERGVKLALTK